MAGRTLVGSGPLGLGIAVGLTVLQTVYYVSSREKKLREDK